ncbi:hypothetical protein [Azospirillum sp. sgz302134]
MHKPRKPRLAGLFVIAIGRPGPARLYASGVTVERTLSATADPAQASTGSRSETASVLAHWRTVMGREDIFAVPLARALPPDHPWQKPQPACA